MKDYDDYEEFDFEDADKYLINMWCSCEFDEEDERYQKCEECENYEDCIENAQDNKDGYASFCDIVSDTYGSVDAFWECNGI